jgi:hypothetical protein
MCSKYVGTLSANTYSTNDAECPARRHDTRDILYIHIHLSATQIVES